jgi:hypothetical protein
MAGEGAHVGVACAVIGDGVADKSGGDVGARGAVGDGVAGETTVVVARRGGKVGDDDVGGGDVAVGALTRGSGVLVGNGEEIVAAEGSGVG